MEASDRSKELFIESCHDSECHDWAIVHTSTWLGPSGRGEAKAWHHGQFNFWLVFVAVEQQTCAFRSDDPTPLAHSSRQSILLTLM